MTEERFYYYGDGINRCSGVIDNDTALSVEETCGIMNEFTEDVIRLENENQQLKSHINDTEVAVEIATEKYMQRVFGVIDKHTEYWSKKHDFAGVDTLLRLKKELKE